MDGVGAGGDLDLEHEVDRGLAGELLALKKASGSSFSQLSQKTHYAKSSWERWVNGKQFPPRDAVESLARLCGTDPGPLLALWDAEDVRRAAPAPGPGPESDTVAAPESGGVEHGEVERGEVGPGEAGPGGGVPTGADVPARDGGSIAGEEPSAAVPVRRKRRALWGSFALAALLIGGVGAYAVAAFSGDEEPTIPEPAQAVKVVGPATGCTLTACEGRDPKKMNCGADAVTVRTAAIPPDLVIELRYSKACKAAWGRISFAEVGATVVVNNSDGAAQADVVHYDRDVYTPLIAAPDHGSVFACADLPKKKDTKDNAPTCTGRFIPSREQGQP
ncbi:DUF2690 domain-containing protein [Streptomyces sp. NPDC046203]|uniref:helix-turn-helix domain-containing protein n=1 Tax=Streptomyces sp. NPDC046203 TaxID=3154602 RepID=UPI0033EA5230